MSYDFELFEPSQRTDQAAALRTWLSESSERLNPNGASEINDEKEKRKRHLAASLIKHNPELEIFEFDFVEIANLEKISQEDARKLYRHLEINGAEDGNGIQMILYDNCATVTLPYGHAKADAEIAFKEIWEYLKIIHHEAGYFVYDPQLERILDFTSDSVNVLELYLHVNQQAENLLVSRPQSSKRPWWRFW
jgi:hypothetical protein